MPRPVPTALMPLPTALMPLPTALRVADPTVVKISGEKNQVFSKAELEKVLDSWLGDSRAMYNLEIQGNLDEPLSEYKIKFLGNAITAAELGAAPGIGKRTAAKVSRALSERNRHRTQKTKSTEQPKCLS